MEQKEAIVGNDRRIVPVFGKLDGDKLIKVIGEIILLDKIEAGKEIKLVICSGGGMVDPSFAFIDTLEMLNIRVTTIGTGGVSSMAILLFAVGTRRLVTEHTDFFLHDFGFHPDKGERVSLNDLERKARDFKVGQNWYARFIEKQTDGKFKASEVLRMMREETSLYPDDLVRLGLAHEII
jgi:ATP-dependent protease ClpP protease subunit